MAVDVSALTQRILNEDFVEFEEGYIVAFDAGRPGVLYEEKDARAPRYKVLFIKPHSRDPWLGWTGGRIDEAHLFPSYDEACTAAQSWVHSNKPTTRILFVQRRRPIEILGDMPTGVLDALAEI